MRFIFNFVAIFLFGSCITTSEDNIKWSPLEKNHFAILQVKFSDGNTVPALFDTGSGGISFDESLQKYGKKNDKKKIKYGSGDGELKVAYFYDFSSIQIGEYQIPLMDAFVHPYNNPYAKINIGSGYMFANKLKIIIDFRNQRYAIVKKIPNNYLEKMKKFQSINKNRHILVDIAIQGQVINDVLLDTGAGLSSLAADVLQKIQATENLDDKIETVDVLGSVKNVKVFDIKEVQAGLLKEQATKFYQEESNYKNLKESLDSNINGILGANFLSKSTLVIDYENNLYGIF